MKLEHVIAKRKNKTIYRDGDNVVKVFDPTYLKTDVLNEALNQARVETTGLNIPKIKAVTILKILLIVSFLPSIFFTPLYFIYYFSYNHLWQIATTG